MPPLLVIPSMPRTGSTAPEELPKLAALGELLRLSDAADTDADWRRGLLRDLGAGPAAIPEAIVAATALGLPAQAPVCIAAPVHAVAGLHRVHLHAAGVLALAEDERGEMQQGFAAQFGADARLHAAAGQWLIEAPCAIAATDSDPADWAGAPLERQPASSPEQRTLRRLGAEIEMWLADLPVNERRRGRGRLPVNLFWMWGGGAMQAPDKLPALDAVKVHGAMDDAWLAGCARLAGGTVLPLPAAWASDNPRSVMVLPAPLDATQLENLESNWFQPALEDLRAGHMNSFELRLGRRLYRVRSGRLRRLWRRSRPWWQVMGT